MRGVRLVIEIGILYIFYYLGVWMQQTFDLFIPGSIIGMLLLFMLLLTRKFSLKWVDSGASFLLSHLPLLFIPVTVGIMDYFSLFKGKGFFSLGIVVVSTLIVFVVSAHVSQWIAKYQDKSTVAEKESEQA